MAKGKDHFILLAVAEPLQHAAISGNVFVDDLAVLKRINTRLMNSAREMLTKYEDICKEKNISHNAVVESGSPRYIILKMATAHDCDLLVLGARGLSTLQRYPCLQTTAIFYIVICRLMLGSTSDFCVNHAPCKVLIVPHNA